MEDEYIGYYDDKCDKCVNRVCYQNDGVEYSTLTAVLVPQAAIVSSIRGKISECILYQYFSNDQLPKPLDG